MNFCAHKVEICSECVDKKVISNFSGEVSVGLLNDLQDYREKIQKLEEENKKLLEALIWCGGSRDFDSGGVARQGWLNICRPLIIKRG